jgi:hypothetical protein
VTVLDGAGNLDTGQRRLISVQIANFGSNRICYSEMTTDSITNPSLEDIDCL